MSMRVLRRPILFLRVRCCICVRCIILILLINTVRCSSSLLVQLKDILKEKRREKFTKVVLFLHDNAPAHRTLATQKKLAYLWFHCLDHPPILRTWPRRTTTCSLDWRYNLKVTIFRPTHCCCGDLVGRTTFWIFLSVLQTLEQRAKKCIELREEYVE